MDRWMGEWMDASTDGWMAAGSWLYQGSQYWGSPVFSPQCKSQAPLVFTFSSIAHPCKTLSWADSRLRGFTNCQNQPSLRAGRAGTSLEKLKKSEAQHCRANRTLARPGRPQGTQANKSSHL